jgi:hypothetical protein
LSVPSLLAVVVGPVLVTPGPPFGLSRVQPTRLIALMRIATCRVFIRVLQTEKPWTGVNPE